MEADDGPQVGAGAGQLQGHGPTEAVPDGGDATAVDRVLSQQHGWLVIEIVPADEPGCVPGQPEGFKNSIGVRPAGLEADSL